MMDNENGDDDRGGLRSKEINQDRLTK